MTVFAEAVDWGAVLEVIWASLLAGVGVTAIFSVGVLGASRAVESRRGGHGAAAGAYAVLTLLAFVAVAAAMAFGIVVMTQKD
ncbi:MAG TPA: hypothetical protein VFD31_09235 [Thermoleophilaceae bacterium]|nr:hypothetical protein [Thermoleophilaceae bacterium]